jgi:cystathionine gamma-lyase/cystathionine gamma-lyase/homocysteine desulfhydrase
MNTDSPYSTILHLRNDKESGSSVTPVYQVSGFEAGSEFFYTRKNNPNSEELETIVATLEGSKYALAVTTGMTAVYMCISLLSPGASVLICSKIYGCSFKLFQLYCGKHNFHLDILDLTVDSCQDVMQNKKYDMCFFETPTNPFLNTVSINSISGICKQSNPDCLIVVDNTWATMLYQKPLNHGADISLYSGTKYFGGHSDVMSGFLLTNIDGIYSQLKDTRFYGGMILSPESAWLVRRSLQTFQIRMEKQSRTTLLMKDELKKIPAITHIYYPEIDGVQLTGYGGILFVEVNDDTISNYSSILKKLRFFGTGTGMACVTSMIAQPYTGSHASLTDTEKTTMGIRPNLLRLCFGLEEPDDLLNDLTNALQ